MTRHDVVVVGGGQAGLSVSWWLTRHGIEHVVLERSRVASSWRSERWDSFCLVTPNWQCRLPDWPYAGPDPDGFMGRDEIVAYVEGFAASFGAPVLEGVEVTSVRPGAAGFDLTTSAGELSAGSVVLAVGGYHRPAVPRLAAAFDAEIVQLHSAQYRNPAGLPAGEVLVVGSGQSGAQIAEDLHRAGRRVHLAVGNAPRCARVHRGRDVVAWLEDMGRYDVPIDEHPEGLAARREANHYVTGRDGGRDIDLRAFALEGMVLHGRLTAVERGEARFAGDLAANLDAADATYNRINATIDAWIERTGADAPPPEPPYEPVWRPSRGGPTSLPLADVSTVVWCTGFRTDWSWVEVPAFDGTGYPVHHRGVTTVPGLYVIGLPWLHTWGSGRLAGIARDAEHVASHIAARAPMAAAQVTA